MKEHDLLDAVGQVSDETVEKYALPDAKSLGTADAPEDFAGSITQTKKKPFRIHMGAAAAAVALCLGLNVAIFYGIHKMRQDSAGVSPGSQVTPGSQVSQVYEEPDKPYMYVFEADSDELGIKLRNPTEEDFEFNPEFAVMDGDQIIPVSFRTYQVEPLLVAKQTDLYFFTYEPLENGTYRFVNLNEDGSVSDSFDPVEFQIPSRIEPKEVVAVEISEFPDLIGISYEDAVQMYGSALRIECESEEYSGYEAGRIFDQDPAPGTPLSEGNTLRVRVSIGSPKVLMPDVTNWDYETAESTIAGLGLYVDKRSAYDSEVEKGKVISTDPVGPIEVEPGSYIRVTVSLGKNGGGMAVPNFSNMQWDNAKSIAEALKFIVSKKEVPDAAPAGTVLNQNVQPNEVVSEGTEIELTVSSGEALSNAVRITFNIPADITGKYHIGLYADGAAAAIGEQFDPEAAAGVTSISMEGEGTAEYQAKLINDENGKEAVLGTYRVDFSNQSVEQLSGDIAQAFAEVQD